MKSTLCDICRKEVSEIRDSEFVIPYELIDFDLCDDCTAEVSYGFTEE